MPNTRISLRPLILWGKNLEYLVLKGFVFDNQIFSCEWTFWYFRLINGISWISNYHSILTFDTVEAFWSLINNIRLFSDLPDGRDYTFFKVDSNRIFIRGYELRKWKLDFSAVSVRCGKRKNTKTAADGSSTSSGKETIIFGRK